jgi:hypothetical protein
MGWRAFESEEAPLRPPVIAEANHETNRRRQKRMDLAFAALSEAQEAMGS